MSPPEGTVKDNLSKRWMSRLLPFAVLAVWSIFFPLGIYGIVALGQAGDQPDTCYGLGWGCVPDAFTSAVLAMLYVGGPVLAVAFLVLVVMTVLRASLKARMWVAAAGPPVAWLVLALVSG